MFKITTLNIKGLNNIPKAQKTLTLLKSYNYNIILIQETNLKDTSTRNFLAQQWGYSSIWSLKTAILAGKRNIELTKIRESQDGCILTVNTEIKQQLFQITNIYTPPKQEVRV